MEFLICLTLTFSLHRNRVYFIKNTLQSNRTDGLFTDMVWHLGRGGPVKPNATLTHRENAIFCTNRRKQKSFPAPLTVHHYLFPLSPIPSAYLHPFTCSSSSSRVSFPCTVQQYSDFCAVSVPSNMWRDVQVYFVRVKMQGWGREKCSLILCLIATLR